VDEDPVDVAIGPSAVKPMTINDDGSDDHRVEVHTGRVNWVDDGEDDNGIPPTLTAGPGAMMGTPPPSATERIAPITVSAT
jgi:hypothetical protein